MKKILCFIWLMSNLNAQIFEQEFLFPQENWHNHSASLVEIPNGDLLAAWYHGSGEGQADDVRILRMRKRQGVYSYATPLPSGERHECIRYVHFDETWIKGE